MAVNLARVQGRYAVTPHGGAGGGARAWRLVTAIPGRLWASCSPASRPVRGVLPLDWDRRHRVTPGETTSQEAWPEAEPWGPTSLWQEPWWDAERRARSALRAPHPKGCGRWLRACRRSASLLFSVLTFVARSADREGTGNHRRCSLAKIGAEGEEIFVA